MLMHLPTSSEGGVTAGETSAKLALVVVLFGLAETSALFIGSHAVHSPPCFLFLVII
jgi:hypothetical protein